MRILAVGLVLVLVLPAVAGAQSREQMQVTADMRMLQEQVSRLQLALNQLADEQKAISKRLDDESAATRKGFADQQLLINNQTDTIGTIHEDIKDNTTRVNQAIEELASIRKGFTMLTDQLNTLVGLLQPSTNPSADASSGTPGASGTSATPSGGTGGLLGNVEVPASPTRIYQAAMGDYMSSHMQNAIDGFTEYLQKFPNAPDAPNAQFFIGEAYFSSKPGRFKDAIDAYQKVIDNYKDSEKVPEAYYKQALSYQNLGQRADAIRIFRLLVSKYPDAAQAAQAQQQLNAMGQK
jgi:tol-pal system protein YbgF